MLGSVGARRGGEEVDGQEEATMTFTKISKMVVDPGRIIEALRERDLRDYDPLGSGDKHEAPLVLAPGLR
jgi:hypothetical protein